MTADCSKKPFGVYPLLYIKAHGIRQIGANRLKIVTIEDASEVRLSPDGRYIVVQNSSPTQTWFDVFEAHTVRPLEPEVTISGNFKGWNCDVNRIVYSPKLSEATSGSSSNIGRVFVLDIVQNSQSPIGLESEFDSMEVYLHRPEHCNHYLLLVTTIGSPSHQFIRMDLSAVNEAGLLLTPFHDQAQLVEYYPDGSLVYRVEDRSANKIPIWHYFRYHGGISQALFSSDDPARSSGWWEFRWFCRARPCVCLQSILMGSALHPLGGW